MLLSSCPPHNRTHSIAYAVVYTFHMYQLNLKYLLRRMLWKFISFFQLVFQTTTNDVSLFSTLLPTILVFAVQFLKVPKSPEILLVLVMNNFIYILQLRLSCKFPQGMLSEAKTCYVIWAFRFTYHWIELMKSRLKIPEF